MTKVTISYAGVDEPAAGLLAGKLEKLGYQVARAPAPASAARRRRKANVGGPVLVLWSRAYANSAGRPKAALATLRLDAAAPPARLRAPAIDLRQWRGREDHRGWRKLMTALGAPPTSARSPKAPSPMRPALTAAGGGTPSQTKPRGSPLAAVLLFVLLAGGGAWALWTYLPH